MHARPLTAGDLDAALELWERTEPLGPVPRAEDVVLHHRRLDGRADVSTGLDR